MAEPSKPADDNLADLVSKSLKEVGGTVFTTPSSSSVKPKKAAARYEREIGPFKQPLSLACAPGGLLVLDRPDADRFRLSRVNAEGAVAGVAAEFAKGEGDAELSEPVSLVV